MANEIVEYLEKNEKTLHVVIYLQLQLNSKKNS
jgi:hypothetical protein